MNLNDNISEENKDEDLLSSLSDKRKKNPFAVPENYFEELAGKILLKIENSEELKSLSPTLSQIEKKNPFKVPENYFSVLESSVRKDAKIIPIGHFFKKNKYSAIAVAAGIAAIISFYFYYPGSGSLQEKELFVSADDISNSMYFHEIDESIIIEEINGNFGEGASHKNNEIEDYLIDNDIDENTLINELW